MGTVNYQILHVVSGNSFLVRWASLSTSSNSADSGIPFPASTDLALAGSLYSDKSVHVFSYGSVATTNVILQGSNKMDVTESDVSIIWATLTDAQGNPLAFTSNTGAGTFYRMEQILENPWYIRPLVTQVQDTSLTPSTAVTVDLLITSIRSQRSGI